MFFAGLAVTVIKSRNRFNFSTRKTLKKINALSFPLFLFFCRIRCGFKRFGLWGAPEPGLPRNPLVLVEIRALVNNRDCCFLGSLPLDAAFPWLWAIHPVLAWGGRRGLPRPSIISCVPLCLFQGIVCCQGIETAENPYSPLCLAHNAPGQLSFVVRGAFSPNKGFVRGHTYFGASGGRKDWGSHII